MLLDTDFLIAIIRKKPEAIEKLRMIINSKEELYITHINLCELYHGAYKSTNPERSVAEVEDMLEFLNILPFTKEVDKKFGQQIVKLYKKGNTNRRNVYLNSSFCIGV